MRYTGHGVQHLVADRADEPGRRTRLRIVDRGRADRHLRLPQVVGRHAPTACREHPFDAGGHLVTCAFEDLGAVSSALEAKLGEAASAKALWRPTLTTTVDEEKAASVLRLVAALEDDDDVQNVYSNFEVSDAVLAKLTAA